MEPTGTHWDIFENLPGILGIHWESTGKGGSVISTETMSHHRKYMEWMVSTELHTYNTIVFSLPVAHRWTNQWTNSHSRPEWPYGRVWAHWRWGMEDVYPVASQYMHNSTSCLESSPFPLTSLWDTHFLSYFHYMIHNQIWWQCFCSQHYKNSPWCLLLQIGQNRVIMHG